MLMSRTTWRGPSSTLTVRATRPVARVAWFVSVTRTVLNPSVRYELVSDCTASSAAARVSGAPGFSPNAFAAASGVRAARAHELDALEVKLRALADDDGQRGRVAGKLRRAHRDAGVEVAFVAVHRRHRAA